LKELGGELESAVAAADDAVKALAAAKQTNREFRTVGERRALFDEFNAMQKRNYGKIAELPHTEAGKT
jgi:acyl-CoA reductase-like NAD-dependent aldehyde dehydrogenase